MTREEALNSLSDYTLGEDPAYIVNAIFDDLEKQCCKTCANSNPLQLFGRDIVYDCKMFDKRFDGKFYCKHWEEE